MARRKTTKKPMAKKKRVYRKRRQYKKKSYPMFTPQAHLPLGQSQMVRHRYLENLQLSTALGTPVAYTFQINGMYDPNISGSGHQPLGYDQMSAIFQAYTVVGARVSFTCWNRDSDEFLGFGIYFSEHGNPLATLGIQGLLEQGASKWVILPPAAQSQGPRTLTAKISTKKFFKVNNIMDDEESRGTTTSNPSRPLFMHVFVWQPDGGSTSAGGSFYMTLDQVAVWNRPNSMAQS